MRLIAPFNATTPMRCIAYPAFIFRSLALEGGRAEPHPGFEYRSKDHRMNTIQTGIAVALAALAIVGHAGPVQAQTEFRPLPERAQCSAWAADLGRGGEPAMEVLTYGWLQACPEDGPSAMATAISAAGQVADTAYLAALFRTAAHIRDAQVFTAAQALASDRSARSEPRVAALMILMGLLDMPTVFNGVGRSALMVTVFPSERCLPTIGFGGFRRVIENPLPADAKRQVSGLVDQIRHDPTESELIRNLARCMRPAFFDVPPQIDVSGVRLTYLCDNLFRIFNPTPDRLYFTLDVQGTDEFIRVSVGEGDELTLFTEHVGTVRLYYDGRLIQTAANGQQECPMPDHLLPDSSRTGLDLESQSPNAEHSR